MNKIKIVNRTGFVKDTEVLDAKTGESLHDKYCITGIKIDMSDLNCFMRAEITFEDIEVDLRSIHADDGDLMTGGL